MNVGAMMGAILAANLSNEPEDLSWTHSDEYDWIVPAIVGFTVLWLAGCIWYALRG